MPMYEYRCIRCGHIEEHLNVKVVDISYCLCEKCGEVSKKIMSSPHFKVTGANAKNGYSSIPTYDEVIDEHGHAKNKWGK